jgi:hypothetical protein
MMELTDIVKSVTQMSDEEIMARLSTIRHSRGQQKEVTVSKRQTAKADKAADSTSAMLAKLGPEQLKQLEQLALLLGGKK